MKMTTAVILMSIPFGLSVTTFWMYVCASILLLVGLIKIVPELSKENGVDKIMPLGRLFYAMPLAVFASEHFTITSAIAKSVPRWIPAHTFWVYMIGAGFFCAALSIVTLVQARLAASLVAFTFFVFVLTMDLPGVVANPHNRFVWALMLRESAFGAAALAFALMSLGNNEQRRRRSRFAIVPRLLIAISSLFYGAEHFLHPTYVPGIPLQKVTPEWIPGHIFLNYIVGAVLIGAGICLVANKKTRTAATALGLTILVAILWVYLPILVATPKDLVALNYFFDTMLFCGAILLLANSEPRHTVH